MKRSKKVSGSLPKMNPKLKAKWVRALRSGKFRRARGQLKHSNAYCCLGVLCEITHTPFIPDNGLLPDLLERQAKLDEDTQDLLTGINDGIYTREEEFGKVRGYREDIGAPFSAIADFIEEHL